MTRRGRYPRGLNPAERWARHRSELIRGTAKATLESADGALSVHSIARCSEKGRSTFYAHFAGVEQALRAVEATASAAIAARAEPLLARASTPREKLRALAEAWLAAVDAEPELLAAMLRSADARWLRTLRDQLEVLLDEARHAGLVSSPPDRERAIAAAGAFGALVRHYAEGQLGRERAATELVDVTLRIFR